MSEFPFLDMRKKPTLEEATEARLAEIRDIARSGVTELTGQARREYGREGAFVGRHGGMKPAYPELERIPDSPAAIARAIDRRSGVAYARIKGVVEEALEKAGYQRARRRQSAGPPVIAGHEGMPHCKHCGVPHAKGQHRSHGPGSFHRTHLFSFNPHSLEGEPGPLDDPRWQSDERMWRTMGDEYLMREFLQMQRAGFNRIFGHNAVQARLRIARELKRRGIYKIPNIFGDIEVNPRNRLRRPVKSNGNIQSIGRALEVRYERTGKRRGYYSHKITTRAEVYTVPAGWFYVPEKSIVIASRIKEG